MKVTLTKQELIEIVSRHLGGIQVNDVVIVKGGFPLLDKTLIRLKEITGVALEVNSIPPMDKKIALIKALREIVPGLGLAEAKGAIENWPLWASHVKFWGKYPKIVSTLPFTVST